MLLDKTSYINVIEEILNNHTKVSNLKISTSKKISYITNFDKRKTSDIKLLNNEEIIDKVTYNKIKPVGFRPGIGKMHKETNNELLLFRPILPVIYTPI